MSEKKGEKGEKASILIHIDEWGHILWATNLDGSPLVYDKDEKKRMHDSDTKLLTPNDCCWRKVGGVMKCSPSYC